ncbi:MAG: FKBP-type peptidyl-prolyl cis-trans isomerase [Bacteroidaceae bacterium]|nr:FKBP-type peptidyl-prolyl cis-trans isomerase [Bacteroidaceae bacterium]MBO4590621.1 FKBP-type peptidyl-prolyl cis-trans isomerase [Bacteroidaceae bacterium]MBR5963494.1 FKBP-type peptidyl-prolyl cis-trans isomerase [Bacteroidaceae bacterium]
MDKYSYGLGMGVAQNLRSMGAEDICVDDFMQAVKDIFEGKQPAISFGEAQDIVQKHFAAIQEKAAAASQEQGETFLRMNKERPGVVTLPSGLQYQVLKQGNGQQPKATDRVRCHYEGRLVDGTVFDSSIQRGEPAVFGVGQVIQGWVEALQLMKEGDKWRLFIPYQLAYGEQGAGDAIPPRAALVFDVELLNVL